MKFGKASKARRLRNGAEIGYRDERPQALPIHLAYFQIA
jgi:hypothetical protein